MHRHSILLGLVAHKAEGQDCSPDWGEHSTHKEDDLSLVDSIDLIVIHLSESGCRIHGAALLADESRLRLVEGRCCKCRAQVHEGKAEDEDEGAYHHKERFHG